MTVGPGRYTEVCTMVRKSTRARAVVLLVLDGNRGQGFEVQTAEPLLLKRLPGLLRTVADALEADVQGDIDTLLDKSH